MEEGAKSSGAGDVTIYLVAAMMGVGQGNASKKLKRSLDEPEVESSAPLPRLGTIRADSTRLRECSKYFETCMSERWTAGAQREFELEVQTEVRFYHDCFARMSVPFEPVASVGDCIELLKVASQIDCAPVLEVGALFLAGVPWSDKEEKWIRDFYASGQLTSSSASDLCKRLQVPSSEEEREQRHFDLTERALRRSLGFSWCDWLHSETGSKVTKERRRVFQETFESIVRGSGPGKRSKLLQISVTMVMEELERLLVSVRRRCQDRPCSSIFLYDLVSRAYWLFKLLRGANTLQGLVELFVKDQDIASLLQTAFQFFHEDRPGQATRKRWAKMMGIIFQDVLEGRLFLKTSQRLDLFNRWNWILKDDHFERQAPLCTKLMFNFILTFPQEEQEEIFCRWLSTLDNPTQTVQHCDLSEVHVLWLKHLVAKADAQKCSCTGGDSERADG